MRVFDAIELAFQLFDFLAVSIHLLASRVLVFIKLVYEEHACSCAIDVEGTIKIHLPVFGYPLIVRCT
jgi:hypothetical protein